MTTKKRLYGNTFPHRDLIKSKGGVWDKTLTCWLVPADSYDELFKAVSAGQFECHDCGDVVYSGTECWETGLTH